MMKETTFYKTKMGAPGHLYPFHHVEIDDYWSGVYGGWRSVVAEMLGTMLYVFASAGLSIACNTFSLQWADFHQSLLIIALGDGLAFMCMVFACQRLSGGHLNPAITWAALITRRIGILKGLSYMLAQVGGGLLGALLISAATPDNFHGRLGSHFWDADLTKFDGFLLITTLTGFLVFVVFATEFDPHNIGKLAPIPIGLTLAFCNLIGYVFVGPSVNPARTLGTAVVYGTYDRMWVFWVAPAAGSTIAALLYTVLFLTREIPAPEVVTTGPLDLKYSTTTAYSTNTAYTVPTETTRLMGSGTV